MRPDPSNFKTRQAVARFAVVISAVASILLLFGCSKSNPLIGKWKLVPNADAACAALDGVQFSDTAMTMNALTTQTVNVTYSRDGDSYVVNGRPTGPMAFQSESGGIKTVTPVECHLVPAN
jgi:hypothetical protein